MCAHVYVSQGTCVLWMYVCRCLGSVCGSLALSLAPGGGYERVNKENEEVLLFVDISPSFRFRAHRRMHRTWRPQPETIVQYCFILLAVVGPGPFSLSAQNSGLAESPGASSLGAQTTEPGCGSGGGYRHCVETGEDWERKGPKSWS